MNIKQLTCLLGLTISCSVQADTLSFSVGGGAWNASPSGSFQKTIDPLAVDVESNLFWEEESQGYLFATLEHFVPIIPNVRIIHTAMDHSGSGNTSFTFDGTNYTGNVSNEFSIETTDIIAYYEVLDNVVSLDLGLNIRSLKVDYTISSVADSTTDSLSETVPMLYALVGASPLPGLIISGEISYIALDGSSISDITAKVAYTTSFLVGVEAGYRKQTFELDDVSDTNSKLDFDGIFAGAYIKF